MGSNKRFFSQGFRRGLKIAGQDPSGGSQGLEVALAKVRARLLKSGNDPSAWVDYGNLLWGQGYAELAYLSYERALAIDPNHVSALVNRAVVTLSQNGLETPWVALAAYQDLSKALKADSFSLVAKYNLAFLLNYYRLYERTLPHWKSIVDRSPSLEVYLSHSIALLGLNKNVDASLAKSEQLAGKEASKSIGYRLMKVALEARAGHFKQCVSMASQLQSDLRLEYFERESLERLQSYCESKNEG
jgi:tetratricopeptide (TPR) repeat protein